MATTVVTSGDVTCFQPVLVNVIQDGDMNTDNGIDAGHSVDAPDMCQKEHSNETLKDEDNNSRQDTQDSFVPPTDSLGMDLSTTDLKDALEKGDTRQESNSEGMKYAPTYTQQLDCEKAKTTPAPDIDGMPSKFLYHTPDLFGNDHRSNPNVYWLSTEFARLISDKRKTVKTTEEMRKEIKAIGLGNVDLSSGKQKSVEDIMREYGLEPSVSSTLSSGSMLNVKSAWMPKSKYSIANVSQNNDTLFGSKSEVDDVKTNGSSVDGEFDYILRRHGSNSNFINVTSSRENASTYVESKRLSRTPSFSYYDFKNTGSSTNLDSVSSSKANLDIKRVDERSINPALYFQRERERLQRIDSVISRTPKSSVTSIAPSKPWELSDSTFSALRRTPSQRSTYLNMDPGMLYEDEKDWGNSSPTRAYLQRASSITGSVKQFSPMSNLSQYQNHDNPIFRDSSTSGFSSMLHGRHYSKSAASPGKHQTTHISKATREPSLSTIKTSKHTSPNERSTTRTLGESSRVYKASKLKPRQSKSCSNKLKSSDNVDKDDFIAKLMKNYSNSHVMAENEMGLTKPGRDFVSPWQGSQDILRRFNFDLPTFYSEPIHKRQNDTKIKNGKYKPYQQSVESMRDYSPDKFKDDTSTHALSRNNMPMGWTNSCYSSKYYLDDENCSPVKLLPGSQVQTITSTRGSTDGKSSSNKFGSPQSQSALTNYSISTANSDSSRGGKNSIRGEKMENFSSRILNDSEDLAMDDSASHSTNSVGEPDLKTNQAEGKSKITKRRKCVPKKKLGKRK